MMYRQIRNNRQVDININHIVEVTHVRNAPTIDDEKIIIELLGDFKYRFTGQEAIDMWDDYRNLILPALGGVLNPPAP